MFPPKMQQNRVGVLSGGEKRRLYLMTVLMKNPNFLILDEPTNDLDLLTLNKLEDFLLEFGGCLMIVSHDRYFMDTLADHLFVFEGKGVIRDFYGNYTEYREDREQRNTEKSEEVKTEDSRVQHRERKLSYKEKLELETLETELEELESRKKELENAMNEADPSQYEELQKMGEEMEVVIRNIDQKSDRWIELSELAQGPAG
jgi:ATP-binding cassette subfamily F protein uup